MNATTTLRVSRANSSVGRPGLRRGCVCKAQGDVFRIPKSPGETTQQAIAAARAAFDDGVAKQLVELLPPLTGATDLDDWPGGIRQMFNAILPMVERFLIDVKSMDGLQCELQPQILDSGDAVGFWSGDYMKAMLFPTADSLLRAKSMEPENPKLFLLINPQWREGQVISDFGIGRKRQETESFLDEFQYTYFLRQYRIQGEDIRVLRCYPGDWCIFVSAEGKESLLCKEAEKPSYRRIEEILKEKGVATGNVFQRLQREFDFNIKSLGQP